MALPVGMGPGAAAMWGWGEVLLCIFVGLGIRRSLCFVLGCIILSYAIGTSSPKKCGPIFDP